MASKVDKKTGIKIASDARVMQIQDLGKKKTERAKLQRTQGPLSSADRALQHHRWTFSLYFA